MFSDFEEKYGRDLSAFGIKTPTKSNLKKRIVKHETDVTKVAPKPLDSHFGGRLVPQTERMKEDKDQPAAVDLHPLTGLVRAAHSGHLPRSLERLARLHRRLRAEVHEARRAPLRLREVPGVQKKAAVEAEAGRDRLVRRRPRRAGAGREARHPAGEHEVAGRVATADAGARSRRSCCASKTSRSASESGTRASRTKRKASAASAGLGEPSSRSPTRSSTRR